MRPLWGQLACRTVTKGNRPILFVGWEPGWSQLERESQVDDYSELVSVSTVTTCGNQTLMLSAYCLQSDDKFSRKLSEIQLYTGTAPLLSLFWNSQDFLLINYQVIHQAVRLLHILLYKPYQ